MKATAAVKRRRERARRPPPADGNETETMKVHQSAAAAIATALLATALPVTSHAQPAFGLPDLVAAARGSDDQAVRDLLEAGADPDAAYGDGTTALHWAAHRDAHALVVDLLAAGADVNAADDHGVTPLSLACVNGNRLVVDVLLKAGADPNSARGNGETPLMTAARVGNLDVARSLIAAGADPNAREATLGQTALMLAVAENHTPVARLLLETGAAATARSTNRFTPLLFAAQQGNLAAADLLLSAGADVDESAPDGIGGNTNARTRFVPDTDAAALLVAIDSGHAEMARFLLARGADPDHDGAGRTALHAAVQRKMPEVVAALLEHGADPDPRLTKRLPFVSRRISQNNGMTPSNTGATPFFLAASYNDLESMKVLVEGGADPMLRADDETTALMVAAGGDYVEGADKYGVRWFGDNLPLQESALKAVKYLLELGLDINARNIHEQTTLHGAVYLGGTLLVPYLVEQGAEIDVVNVRGQTPWMVAAEGEYRSGSFYTHEETGEVLEQLGADKTLGEDLGPNFREVLAAREQQQQQ